MVSALSPCSRARSVAASRTWAERSPGDLRVRTFIEVLDMSPPVYVPSTLLIACSILMPTKAKDMTLTAPTPETAVGSGDVAGHIETRGIDYIPDAERHSRPRALFGIWAAANVLYLNFVFGG